MSTGQPAYIELYTGWATTQRGGFVYGRVHKGGPLPLPKEGDGLETKLDETFRTLDVRALAGAQVRLSGFPGASLFAADGHGFLMVPLPVGMPPGTLRVTAQLETPNYTAAPATTPLQVQVMDSTNPPVGVISDIDDTLTDTRVTDKPALLRNTFFRNTYEVPIFLHAPDAVVAIAGKKARTCFRRYRSSISPEAHGPCMSASRTSSTARGCRTAR